MKHYSSLLKLAALVGALGISIAPNAMAEWKSTYDHASDAGFTRPQELAQTTGNIVEVASSDPNFSTLVQAVEAAELVDLLSGPDTYTVFAPTNDAFNALPSDVLNGLLLPENQDLLTDVLAYHVVPGEVMSSDLETGLVDTLNGGLAVNVSPDRVVVNDASVIQPDVPASNGVIHAINRVLVPPGLVEELQARTGGDTDETGTTQEPVRGLW